MQAYLDTSSPAAQVRDQHNHEQHQEDEEQDLCDAGRGYCNSAETEYRRDDRHYQK